MTVAGRRTTGAGAEGASKLRSFRGQLSLRAAGVMALAMTAISAISVWALASVLDREIDATVLSVAAIQAASLTDDETGDMHFHDWELTPEEAGSVQELVRYAQVWQTDGESLLRSQYMTSDLPLDTANLRRAGAGELVWTEGEFEEAPVRVLYYPLERLGAVHERHVLQVAAPMGGRNELVTRVALFLALLTATVTGATVAGSWWLAGRAIRPVHEVIDQAEAIEVASLDRRIRSYAETREYRRLVDVLNTMLGRIQSAFEAQRRFTADASHELRSPLTAMRGELEIALRRERPPEEYRRVLGSTLEEVVRLSRIAEDLLLLARSDAGVVRARAEPVDLAGVVERVLDRLKESLAGKRQVASFESEGDVTAQVDPVLVGQVVWNVVENATKFTPVDGRIDVRLSGADDAVTLVVEDSGPGIPDEMLGQVFERFFRGDPARRHGEDSSGTGLGLGIVDAVVKAHGGTATAENRPEGGARLRVTFPKRTPEPAVGEQGRGLHAPGARADQHRGREEHQMRDE